MKYKNIRGEGDYRYYKSLVFLTSAKGDWGGGWGGERGGVRSSEILLLLVELSTV